MAIVAYIVELRADQCGERRGLRDRTTGDVDIDTEQVATTRAAQA